MGVIVARPKASGDMWKSVYDTDDDGVVDDADKVDGIQGADLLKKDGSVKMTGDFDLDSHFIRNVTNPASAQDADTKSARDNAISSHAALDTGVHGVGSLYVAGIESPGAEAPLKAYTCLLTTGRWFHEVWQTLDKWTEQYTGSASRHSWNIMGLVEKTGTTASSEARLFSPSISNLNLRLAPQSLYFVIQNEGVVPNSCQYLLGVWDSTVAKPPSLTSRHVGWKVINQRIWATNADGATERATDTGIDMSTAYNQKRLFIECTQDNGEIKYYVDDVLVATHTQNIPDHTNSYVYISVKTTNTTENKLNTLLVAFRTHA